MYPRVFPVYIPAEGAPPIPPAPSRRSPTPPPGPRWQRPLPAERAHTPPRPQLVGAAAVPDGSCSRGRADSLSRRPPRRRRLRRECGCGPVAAAAAAALLCLPRPAAAMGSLLSRRIAGVEDIDIQANSAYRYPPKSGEGRGAAPLSAGNGGGGRAFAWPGAPQAAPRRRRRRSGGSRGPQGKGLRECSSPAGSERGPGLLWLCSGPCPPGFGASLVERAGECTFLGQACGMRPSRCPVWLKWKDAGAPCAPNLMLK